MKTTKHRSLLCLRWLLTLAVVTTLPAIASDNLQHELSQIESGMLVIAPRHNGGDFSSSKPLSTDVSIDVSGQLARAQVTQTFRNPGEHWIEAIYAFPLPDNARVDHMEIRVGERTIVGEIRGKAQAQQEYTQALNEGKRASLLQSHRANLFTNRVANIPPQESVQVVFSYQWQINYDDGVFGLRVPLTITPRYLPGERLRAAQVNADNFAQQERRTPAGPTRSVVADAKDITPPMTPSQHATPTSIFITINTALPLESVSSASHDIHTDQTDTHWRVSLANGMVPTDRDFTLTWSPLLGHSPLAAVFTESQQSDDTTQAKEQFASVMVMPPQALFQTTQTAREVILVIDTSGSMQGNSIRQARAALQFAIERLNANDTFNVIEFNSVTRSLFNTAMPASDANKRIALLQVRSLRADGGTEIAAAIDASLGTQPTRADDRLRQVVFITDGSVGNEAELFLQIKDTLHHSRLFTVGIGSAPNTWFMRRAAEVGRGTYTYIAKEDEVRTQMRQLLQKLEYPVLTGITLQWQGIDSPEVYPAVIPDLYAGEPIRFDARWYGDATGSLTVSGLHNGNPWTRQLPIDQQQPSTVGPTTEPTSSTAAQLHSALAKQWAHRKIESMENSMLFADDHATIESEITALALQYSMVTRYTSLIAVDHESVPRPATDKTVPAPVPSAMPHGNTMLLPQGGLGIDLRLLMALFFSVGATIFGLATLRQVRTHGVPV
jgi:Ca-activated chloride channel family protein